MVVLESLARSESREQHIDLAQLRAAHPAYLQATAVEVMKVTAENGTNVTVVHFENDNKGN